MHPLIKIKDIDYGSGKIHIRMYFLVFFLREEGGISGNTTAENQSLNQSINPSSFYTCPKN